MKLSQTGWNLIKQFEGYRSEAYLCPGGVWTIGYGTTRYPNGTAVKKGDKCTENQAREWKENDIRRFINNVMKFNPTYKWNQNEFDALVSFAYNVGSINQLTQNGKRTKAQIAAAMPLYNKSAGQVLAGLVRRREAERVLFLTQAGSVSSALHGKNNPFPTPAPTIRQGSPKVHVQWLQWQLNDLGYPLVVDGIWGPRTQDAVLTFQRNHRLAVDGLVGPATKSQLTNKAA
ncbi:MAG: peptidoglycan-binding protein [Lachnospiraceae bacterium]|nr:peptidoglycan-binding protein [Lachnospiraceae bacterium]